MSAKSIPLPIGTYQLPEVRASVRRLVNCFAEQTPQGSSEDSKNKDPGIILRRSPGISTWCTLGTGAAVRGLWMMEGGLWAVSDRNLYSIDKNGTATLQGTGIIGTGRVHITDNSQCLIIVVPQSFVAYTWTASTGLMQITSPFFTGLGASNCGFLDSYIVFLQQSGRGFFNDDGQIVSGLGPITFTTTAQFPREFGTDPFVGMGILNRTIYMFGQLTSEGFIDTGAGTLVGSPFTSAPNNFIELGCANGETVVKQNQTLIYLANDLTVRTVGGDAVAQRVSNHSIEAILQAGPVTDAYGLAFSISGHILYVLTLPTAGRSLVYDFITKEWHEMGSYGLGYWRPFCSINGYGMQLVGDSQKTGVIGKLDPAVFTEFGGPMIATWIHQPVYDAHNRIRHRRLEIVLGTGQAPLTGQGSNPKITMQYSDDGGHTWTTAALRDLGMQGYRQTRAVWWNLGMSRERVYQFNLSDPVELWLTDATLEAFPAKN